MMYSGLDRPTSRMMYNDNVNNAHTVDKDYKLVWFFSLFYWGRSSQHTTAQYIQTHHNRTGSADLIVIQNFMKYKENVTLLLILYTHAVYPANANYRDGARVGRGSKWPSTYQYTLPFSPPPWSGHPNINE